MKLTNKEEFNRQTQETDQMMTASHKGLGIDYDYFEQFVDDPNVSEEQKRAYMEIVWSVVCSALDLGLNIHPLQQAAAKDTDLSLSQEGLMEALKQIALQDD